MWDPEFALEKEILTDPYRSIQIHTRFWDPAFGPVPPFLQSPLFIVRRHSSLYQSSVNQQPWQRRPHDIDGPEDETETDGKEISGLLHTTKCHGEYGSISS